MQGFSSYHRTVTECNKSLSAPAPPSNYMLCASLVSFMSTVILPEQKVLYTVLADDCLCVSVDACMLKLREFVSNILLSYTGPARSCWCKRRKGTFLVKVSQSLYLNYLLDNLEERDYLETLVVFRESQTVFANLTSTRTEEVCRKVTLHGIKQYLRGARHSHSLYFRSSSLSIGMFTSLYPNNWGINLPTTVPGCLKLPSISSTKVTLLGLTQWSQTDTRLLGISSIFASQINLIKLYKLITKVTFTFPIISGPNIMYVWLKSARHVVCIPFLIRISCLVYVSCALLASSLSLFCTTLTISKTRQQDVIFHGSCPHTCAW